jgi:hypothetical protein
MGNTPCNKFEFLVAWLAGEPLLCGTTEGPRDLHRCSRYREEYRDWYMDLLAALKRDKSVKGNLRHEWRRKFKLELRRIESFFAILDRETVQARAETIH